MRGCCDPAKRCSRNFVSTRTRNVHREREMFEFTRSNGARDGITPNDSLYRVIYLGRETAARHVFEHNRNNTFYTTTFYKVTDIFYENVFKLRIFYFFPSEI